MAQETPNNNERTSGVLGMNEKLGLLRKPLKRKAQPLQPSFNALPQLPDIRLKERQQNNDFAPGGSASPIEGSAMDKMKNKLARSMFGGNKEMI